MDEGKSYKGLIFAYAGVAVVVVAIGLFIARGVSHNDTIVMHGGATATPLVVGVYNGIRPDATATPTAAPSATPSPGPSQSPSPQPSSSAKGADAPKPVHAVAQKSPKHAHRLLAEAQTGRSSDAADAGSQAGPIQHADRPVDAPTAPPLVATPEPTAAPTVAPATPAAVAAAEEEKPVFAPERVVDAQVRNAVQPDYSEMDRERGAHGTSVVLVTIDPKGQVVGASVASSSGFSSLDRAAVAAARASTFVAPKINGRPATETYRLVYDF